MTKPLFEQVEEAAGTLRERGARPKTLVILGTGLGGFVERFAERSVVPYADVPHFPVSTSPGHPGELVIAKDVLLMAGRQHYYEGYSMERITMPIRVARALGAETLLITSAVGGMHPSYDLGEIVVIEDHIHLMGDSPLRGENDDRLGPRFPDMSAPYDRQLIEKVEAISMRQGRRLPRAVLASVSGPQLETRAEYRFLRAAGADVVGMSTTPEAIVAVHAGLRTCALSVVTDLCFPDSLEPADVERIIAAANAAAPRLETLLLGLLDLA